MSGSQAFYQSITYSQCILPSFQGTFIFNIVQYQPLKFNKTYVYPDWAYILGWFLGLFCVFLVPLWIIYKLTRSKMSAWQVKNPLI